MVGTVAGRISKLSPVTDAGAVVIYLCSPQASCNIRWALATFVQRRWRRAQPLEYKRVLKSIECTAILCLGFLGSSNVNSDS